MQLLSRRAYQVVALASLVLVYALAFELCYRAAVPFATIVHATLAWVSWC